MHRVERPRRSTKKIVEDYADELLARKNDPDAKTKLLALEAVAFRMGWTPLYNRLRFKSGLHTQQSHFSNEPEEPSEKWWQK